MILRASTTLTGHIQGDENLEVQGRVNGMITLKQNLTISSEAIVQAHIHAREVQISGIVVGDIHAQDKIELAPRARVVGMLQAPQVIIHEGAQLRGTIDMGTLEPPVQTRPVSPKLHALPDPALAGIETGLPLVRSTVKPHRRNNQLPPISKSFETVIYGTKRD